MKNQKLIFEFEDTEVETIHLGLLRQVKNFLPHEFFFKINNDAKYSFRRIDDLEVYKSHFHYAHMVYEACDTIHKNRLIFIKNKSSYTKKVKEFTELFIEETEENYLIPMKEVDYIIKTSDNIEDFSVILLPENIAFNIQHYTINSDEELYQLIQYYE